MLSVPLGELIEAIGLKQGIGMSARDLICTFESISGLLFTEHFDYDRRSLSYASFIARSILCYRICKCVTLGKTHQRGIQETIDDFVTVGYNTRSSQYEIKSTILRMMKSMRHASSLYSPLVAQ